MILLKKTAAEHQTDFALKQKKLIFREEIFENLPNGQYGHFSLFCMDNLFNASLEIT
jgi:hypothetical protein